MKKTKVIPALLMMVLCVAVFCMGIYAASSSTNSITGTIKIGASAHEVSIQFIKDGTVVATHDSVRAGVDWEIPNLEFVAHNANTVDQVEMLDLTLRITNKSDVALGVYFFKEGTTLPGDGIATSANLADLIQTLNTKENPTKTLATAYLTPYTYIAPKTSEYKTVDMSIDLCLNQLFDFDATADFNFNLNIEEYKENWLIDDSYAYVSDANLVKISDKAGVFDIDPEYGDMYWTGEYTELTGGYTKNGLSGMLDSAKFVVFPSGHTIANDVISSMTALEVLHLPQNITTLPSLNDSANYSYIYVSKYINDLVGGVDTFYTNKINNVFVNKYNTKFDSRNACNAVIETATNMLVMGSKNVVIPNGVESLGVNSLQYYVGDIVLPDSVKAIYAGSFFNASVGTITFGLKFEHLGDDSFAGSTAVSTFVFTSKTPPTVLLGTGVMGDSTPSTIKCPAASLTDYQEAFSDFSSITFVGI